MNLLHTIETAFIGATAIAITSATLLMPRTAELPEQQAAPMQVVVVSAKRLTLEEKLQSLREERQLAMSRQTVARG